MNHRRPHALTWTLLVGLTGCAGDVSDILDTAVLYPPTAPSDVSARAESAFEVELRWADTSENEAGFRVDRSSAADGPWEVAATPSSDTTSVVESGLTPESTYFFRVTALNAAGEATSEVTSVTLPRDGAKPMAPTGLLATPATASIELRWNAAEPGPEAEVTGYRVFLKDAQVSEGADLVHQDTQLASGVEYCYTVRAVSSTGAVSEPSAEACATPL